MLKIKLMYKSPDRQVIVKHLSYDAKKRGAPGPREKKLKMDPSISNRRISKVKRISKVSCRQIKQITAARLKSTLSTHNVTKSKENVEFAFAAPDHGQVELASTVKPSTPVFSVPLSPKQGLHAARIKLSFADAIVKGNNAQSFQQQKAIFEREQLEEIARLEAIVTEGDREEARVALEKVERRTCVFEDNLYILQELKKLSDYYGSSWGPHFRSPLERLGLYLKDDYTIEVDELEEGEIVGDGELEEGEIV